MFGFAWSYARVLQYLFWDLSLNKLSIYYFKNFVFILQYLTEFLSSITVQSNDLAMEATILNLHRLLRTKSKFHFRGASADALGSNRFLPAVGSRHSTRILFIWIYSILAQTRYEIHLNVTRLIRIIRKGVLWCQVKHSLLDRIRPNDQSQI